MHRCEKQNVDAKLSLSRILRFNLPMRCEKCEEIDDDQSDRNDRPAAARHIFVAQRNQHGSTLLDRTAKGIVSSLGEAWWQGAFIPVPYPQ
jgi:hypothetical protein